MICSELKSKFICLRQAAISRDFTHLNDTQRKAVMATQGPLLLLAGAGSGKTTVLINRIANILKYGEASDSEYVPDDASESDIGILEAYLSPSSSSPEPSKAKIRELCAVDPVPPWRIIAITFTNKSATELKQRLEKMFGQGSEDIWASTFHSACVRILRRYIDRLGYERSFAIYDTSDSASLMKRILKDLDIEERTFTPKAVLGYISRAKDAMISADDFLSSAEINGDARRKQIGRAYLEYESRLKSSNALDFDDLILKTTQLFKENPDVLRYYQDKFKYVLVDEYQDTNNLQYLLVSMLAGGHNNICVVGDDDQSIYKFRGATIENILNFEKQFKNARVIRLEQNYRSTGYILDAANDVIRNNHQRKGKKLWTDNERGDKPELRVIPDELEEARFVADTIIASSAQGRRWDEHAILYRMNAQSNQLETAFKRVGIPYRIIGGTGFYERAEIKDMLAYMCVIYNPRDDVRLLRIINTPPRGIGATTVNRLTVLATQSACPVYDIIGEALKHEELKSSAGRLQQFADMIAEIRENSDIVPLDELYDILISQTGYIKMLEEKKTYENQSRIENVRELKTNIIRFMNEQGGSLFDFLSETTLFTDLDRDDQSVDRVQMMTMHSAKGLEFDTVFIVGAEEGIFPGIRSIGEPDEIEEERRLCYVAMTRAMRKLYFTSAWRRMLFGKTMAAQPSRFLEEIRKENIDVFKPRHKYHDFSFADPIESLDHDTGDHTHGSPPLPSSSSPLPVKLKSRETGVVPKPSTDQTVKLRNGDKIEHKVFGYGVVTNISRVGGDSLLEIAFEKTGTKRMMLNSASRYIKKAGTG
ncbi:MAG: UvrD-helicase domain-containing protein [Oscillospiraceae bacterium]|nr:UvrD-helicase domain-containing protein [Oscillospiraceae bacterium]